MSRPAKPHKGPAETLSRRKIVQALLALTTKPGTETEAAQYFEQVITGFGGVGVGARGGRNDRGAALLIASNLENSLRIALERRLDIETHRNEIFVIEYAPLRDFDAKIRMGHALGLFGPQTYEDLKLIKYIRNAFAHAPSPISFSTVEIRQACDLLRIPAPVGRPENADTSVIGRDRFRLVCERMSLAFRYVPNGSKTS